MGIDVLSQFPLITVPLADAGLLFIFLIAAGVTAMTFVGFTMWAAYHAIRVVVLLLARLALLPRGGGAKQCRWPPALQAEPQWLACPDPVCRTVNPDHARFCRQCGRMVRKPVQIAA